MLHWLLFNLKDSWFGFNLLKYISFRSLGAFITAFIIGLIIAPYFINKFKNIGIKQSIRNDGPESHQVKSGTPTMGGIFIIIAAFISILLWSIGNIYVIVTSLSIILFGSIGFLDDYLKIKYKNSKGVTAKLKLILQTFSALIIIFILDINLGNNQIFWKFYLPFFDEAIFVWPKFFGYLFYTFTIVAFSNATNISDGLDGLATGMGMILYVPFGIIAYVMGNAISAQYLKYPLITGSGELTIVVAAMIGALIAFLWYNVHPAEVFMGDTGSLAMGGVIAVIAIILKHEMLLVIAGGVFVVESVSVLVQTSYFKYTKRRFGSGKRVFLMAPIHHHFEKKGWKETQVVVRFWILSALCALIALSTLKIR